MFELKGTRIYWRGEEYVPLVIVQLMLSYVLTRKQRKQGMSERMKKQLKELGRTSYTWRFTYKKKQERRSEHFVKLRIREITPGFYMVSCFGSTDQWGVSKAAWVVDRANEGPERLRRWIEQKSLHRKNKLKKVQKKPGRRHGRTNKKRRLGRRRRLASPSSRRRHRSAPRWSGRSFGKAGCRGGK